MEFRQLRYFCAIARTGSFTRGAAHAGISQPSLSIQIRKLEDELGAKLFDRSHSFACLTPSGQALLTHAQSILRQLAAAKLERWDRGAVVVGATPSIVPNFLASCLSGFSRSYPRDRVTAVEGIQSELLSRMRGGEIDLAFCALPVEATDCFCYELSREPLWIVVPDNHPLASSRGIDLGDVKNDPFLLLKKDDCFRNAALASCERAHVRPKIIFESEQFATILAMVAAGIGVSIVPQMIVAPTEGCRFVALTDKGVYYRIGVIRVKRQYLNSASTHLLAHLGIANT